MNKLYLLLIFGCAILLTPICAEEVKSPLLSIDNEFIRIIINNEAYDTGRFSIETTQGDPQRLSDDNQPLIYGRPKPWTSFTTIFIDGESYIFGGPTKKRAGKRGPFGKLISQHMMDGNLITICQFDSIFVTQTLSFFRNPQTRVKDMALISYTVDNKGNQEKKIGVRIMMDTQLGSNDGAPFRIGSMAVESETKFQDSTIQDFWQTFDNLASPNVIAQGTLSLKDAHILAPNRMYLVNWGTLADHPWDFTFKEGNSFVRTGETEKDTSLALYWDPISVASKTKRTVKTLYGLGGLTLSPGELSLGLSSPSEIVETSKNDILVVGYVYNAGGFTSKNTYATLTIPDGFEVIQGQAKQNIGDIPPGSSKQIAVKLALKGAKKGIHHFKLDVISTTLDANNISRNIDVLGPPDLLYALTAPSEISPSYNEYFDVSLTVKNPEPFDLYGIQSKIQLDNAFSIPDFDIGEKEIDVLKPGQEIRLNWKLQLNKAARNRHPIILSLESALTQKATITHMLNITLKPQQVSLLTSLETIQEGDYFYVELNLKNAKPFDHLSRTLVFDDEILDLIRISPGYFVLDSHQTEKIIIEKNKIMISNLYNTESAFNFSICKVHFKAKRVGEYQILLKNQGKIETMSPIVIESKSTGGSK
ncbi:MAG: hypothetical protein HRT90_01765 [Candidatus Margulisbacteria bacterium]|nr:hypothetical protein [Candidatus Margulisiibacteriota bacterium]